MSIYCDPNDLLKRVGYVAEFFSVFHVYFVFLLYKLKIKKLTQAQITHLLAVYFHVYIFVLLLRVNCCIC